MDSLTQIVLGAATGEVVLGKKIGNRAMVWGAVGGTIPDLDVLGGFFLSELDNLAFHRGISHSIAFSIIGGIVFGWGVYHLYRSRYHKWIATILKAAAAIVVGFALDFVFRILFPGNYIPTILAVIGLGFLWYYTVRRRYFKLEWQAPKATVRDWQLLFFFSLLTHPILDCFTIYGTQLFAPFSNARIAWGTISVVDPLYTLPFLICLIIASRETRNYNKRRFWNYMGIGLSSLYLTFTVLNKQHVNRIFANALEQHGIESERFITNSSILNNILWNCTAETDEYFYVGQYSLFDEADIEFTKVEKNHELVRNIDSDHTIKTLRWFSDDYFTITRIGEKYQFNDLRFGTFFGKGEDPNDFIFRFKLTDRGEQGYFMEKADGGPPKGTQQEVMEYLWERMQGKKL